MAYQVVKVLVLQGNNGDGATVIRMYGNLTRKVLQHGKVDNRKQCRIGSYQVAVNLLSLLQWTSQ
jgi:hypothetical protein